jgi:aminopeptidase N
MDEIDPDAIHSARRSLRRHIAAALQTELLASYRSAAMAQPYSPDARSAGRRALRNLCLGYLMELDDAEIHTLCVNQFDQADNMTDTMAALSALANSGGNERESALRKFYEKWKDEPLVVDKWFAVQATSRLIDTLATVKRLMQHPAFTLKNPNRVRSLVSSFCHGNQVRFHAADGSGYSFAADQIIAIDALNPQVAARLSRSFDRWKKFNSARQAHAREALQRIRDTAGLSKDSAEVVTRALA